MPKNCDTAKITDEKSFEKVFQTICDLVQALVKIIIVKRGAVSMQEQCETLFW